MEFFIRFDTDQLNVVLKGLEVLREGATNTHTYLIQQAQAQAQSQAAKIQNTVAANQAPALNPEQSTSPAA